MRGLYWACHTATSTTRFGTEVPLRWHFSIVRWQRCRSAAENNVRNSLVVVSISSQVFFKNLCQTFNSCTFSSVCLVSGSVRRVSVSLFHLCFFSFFIVNNLLEVAGLVHILNKAVEKQGRHIATEEQATGYLTRHVFVFLFYRF